MLHHYVPRFYLKGFANGDEAQRVWVYDKEEDRHFCASVAKVAAEHGFYSDEDEVELNTTVEVPGNRALERLRRGEAISLEERAALAIYMAVFLMRVPSKRERGRENAPKVIDTTVDRVYDEIRELAERENLDQSLVRRRLAEVENLRSTFKEDFPKSLVEQIESPWPTKTIVDAIYTMRWRFGVSHGPSFFATSDNPVYFFGAYGLGTSESELTFPISSTLVLFADRQASNLDSFYYRELPRQYVHEANRRLASGASRFVFYHEHQDWVAKIARKRHPYLSRILWTPA